MPYKTTKDLPDPVRAHLPLHGQEIYLKAFNNAWEEYANPKKRNSTAESQEEVPIKWLGQR